jgi:hypothetical protein
MLTLIVMQYIFICKNFHVVKTRHINLQSYSILTLDLQGQVEITTLNVT